MKQPNHSQPVSLANGHLGSLEKQGMSGSVGGQAMPRSVLSCLWAVVGLFALLMGSVGSAHAAVVSGSYTGDGTNGRAITVGFQPDIVIIQRADTGMKMQFRVTGMTEGHDLAVNAGNTSGTDRITALTSTGFTVNSNGTVSTTLTDTNSNGIAYEYLAISQVAGEIKVGTYTGDGTDNRSITGIGFQPDFVQTKRTGQTAVWRTNTFAGDLTSLWDGNAPFANGIQALQADGFQVGSDTSVNFNGGTYWYIACKKVAGKFNTGSYTGTGLPRSITGVGFRSEGLFIKRESTTSPGIKWASSGVNVASFMSVLSAIQGTNIIASLDADGFSLPDPAGASRTNGATAPNTYHWFAFAPVAAAAPAPTVTGVNSSTGNGALKAGQAVSIQVTFDSSVTVTGTPTLALNTGGSASYTSGSPGTVLNFTYTVGAGQNVADLDYSSTSALALAGGTINATTGGTAATLTLPAPGAAGSLGANKAIVIDTTLPTVTVANPSVSTIAAGAGSVTYAVTYADANFASSSLTTGGITLNKTGTANGTVGLTGSGTSYTVTISSITGVGTLGITVGANTSLDTAANANLASSASTTFAVTASGGGTVVLTHTSGNTGAVPVSRYGETSRTGEGLLAQCFTTGSTATTLTKVTLNLGASSGTINGSSQPIVVSIYNETTGTAYRNQTGPYVTSPNVPQPGSQVTGGSLTPVNPRPTVAGAYDFTGSVALAANTSYWIVVSSADASGAYNWLYDNNDGAATSSSGWTVRALNSNSAMNLVDTSRQGINIWDNFDGYNYLFSITASAAAPTPSITVNPTSVALGTTTTGTAGTAQSFTVSGSNLTADIVVTAPTNVELSKDSGSTWQTSQTLTPSSGTVGTTTIQARIAASASLGAVTGNITCASSGATTQNISVNGTVNAPAPTISNVTSGTADGSYKVAALIPITLNFSAPVTVTGTPTLALNSGGSATYSSGTGTNALIFNYTVAATQNSADLDYSSTSALALAGGAINATTGGTAATLTLPAPGATGSLGANKAIVIDTTAPTVTSIVRQTPTGQTTALTTVTFRVTYSEPVLNASTTNFSVVAVNGSNIVGTVQSVTGSGNTRDVTVNITSGTGEFRLRALN